MKRSLLYYPKINIEDNEWLRNAILYWDEVCSIVPRNCDYLISPELQYLEQQDFYRALNPMDLFISDFRESFEDEVIKRLNYCINVKKDKAVNIHKDKIMMPDMNTIINYHKMSNKLYCFMEKNNLIQVHGNDVWLQMNSEVANLYMSILAKYLAKIDHNDVVIGTDSTTNFMKAYNKAINNNGEICLINVMDRILPSPSLTVPIEDLIKFKNTRRNELLHFREVIDEYESQLKKSEDTSELKHMMVLFSNKLEREISDVEKLMKENRIEYRLSSLKSLIEIQVPNALFILGQAFGSPRWITGLSLATNGALAIGTNILKLRKKQDEVFSNCGFSYLYYAKQSGIIGNQVEDWVK